MPGALEKTVGKHVGRFENLEGWFGHYLPHSHIQADCPELYRKEGMHLSNRGLARWLWASWWAHRLKQRLASAVVVVYC